MTLSNKAYVFNCFNSLDYFDCLKKLISMKYSFVVPVYNRPDEVDELLDSLTRQTFGDFEVIIVEDGSAVTCKDVCAKYENRLALRYFAKPNSGPGQSRNYGAERSKGEYLIVLDSDVVLPEGYLLAVDEELNREPADAFGGPDRAHVSFTDTQKAISYSMTSFFTTGGIRGGKKKLDIEDLYEKKLFVPHEKFNRRIDILVGDLRDFHSRIDIVRYDAITMAFLEELSTSEDFLLVSEHMDLSSFGLNVLPVDWNYKVQYGLVYSQKPESKVEDLIRILEKQ